MMAMMSWYANNDKLEQNKEFITAKILYNNYDTYFDVNDEFACQYGYIRSECWIHLGIINLYNNYDIFYDDVKIRQ